MAAASTSSSHDTCGYDHDFVDDAAKYECPLCLHVARKPVQTECGHFFCEECWGKYLDSTGANKPICPVDKKYINIRRVFPDVNMARCIDDLKVRCDYKNRGCEKVVELRYLQKHMSKDCRMKCELQCGADILRSDMDNHTSKHCPSRWVQCDLCDTKMLAKYLEGHKRECPNVTISCEWCHVNMPKNQMDEHISTCPEYPTYCSFAVLGCYEKVKRNLLPQHHESSTQAHLQLLLFRSVGGGGVPQGSLGHTQYELSSEMWGQVATATSWDAAVSSVSAMSLHDNESENKKLTEVVKYIQDIEIVIRIRKTKSASGCDIVDGGYYDLPVSCVAGYHMGLRERWCSPPFYTREGYQMRLYIVWTYGQLQVCLQLQPGDHDDRPGMWPWHGPDMCLVVEDVSTGEILKEGTVVPVGHEGRLRPTADHTGRFLIMVHWSKIECSDNFKLTLKRKL